MTKLVVIVVGVGLFISLCSITYLAAHDIEPPDALGQFVVGALGLLGGILVPNIAAGSHVLVDGQTVTGPENGG